MHTNRGCPKSEASESEEPLKGNESRNALERANAFQAECENRSFVRQMRPSYIDRNLLVPSLIYIHTNTSPCEKGEHLIPAIRFIF